MSDRILHFTSANPRDGFCIARQPDRQPSTELPMRAHEIGIPAGRFDRGAKNAITDVADVRVGHITRIEGEDIRTGATAVLPHSDNLYQHRVPAGLAVANGYGKFMGATQIHELGELETPVILTNTLSIPQAADALIDWTLRQSGNENVQSVNPVVGETNDGVLNAIRRRVLTRNDFLSALEKASNEPVEEGAVGAGTGTMAFGRKGGIGTSSRQLPSRLGGFVVGVLVQSNYGGSLKIDGHSLTDLPHSLQADGSVFPNEDGSIVIVIATDAPLSDRNLNRLAWRAFAGMARTGSAFSNGSGDYALAFSTATSVRRTPERRSQVTTIAELPNDLLSPLFVAVAEATQEAIYNSLFQAGPMTSRDPRSGKRVFVEAFDIEGLRHPASDGGHRR